MSDTPRTDALSVDVTQSGWAVFQIMREHARELERENARLRLENAQVLQENLRLRKLVEEVISAHADPESPWYNECSLSSPCAWCDAASAALTA